MKRQRKTASLFLFCFLFFFFFNVLTRQILFDNMKLETSVFRVKATLEIKKRHGNSRENFVTEEETSLGCRKMLTVSLKF